jgi:hypothetical protein
MIHRSSREVDDACIWCHTPEHRLLLPDDVADQDFYSCRTWDRSTREQGRCPPLLGHYGDELE